MATATTPPGTPSRSEHRHRRHKRRRTRWKRHLLRKLGVGLIVMIVLGYVLFLWYMAVGAPDAPADIPR
jgi:cell division septal protein FtsQ